MSLLHLLLYKSNQFGSSANRKKDRIIDDTKSINQLEKPDPVTTRGITHPTGTHKGVTKNNQVEAFCNVKTMNTFDDVEHPSELRGIFGEKGDSLNWLDATSKFPNGVPRFESQAECLDFMQKYNKNNGGSNPDFPHLRHIFTTLITWEQIEHILLPAIEKARKEPSFSKKVPRSYGNVPDNSSKNIYEQPGAKEVVDAINFRCFQNYFCIDFHGAKCGRGISCEVGVSSAGGKDDHSAFFKVANSSSSDIRLCNFSHLDGSLYTRVDFLVL